MKIHMPFERENELPTANILIVDVVFCVEIKKLWYV